MMKLRPYQQQAKEKILKSWAEGYRKSLMVLPTGCGKTIVFSSITEEKVKEGDRILILAHLDKLLKQAAEKLRAASGLDAFMEKGKNSVLKDKNKNQVVISSVQTMSREKRLEQFPHDYFQEIIVDETHHCLSPTYQRILNYFPTANILGVTATPDRGDMKDLGSFFDRLAFQYDMRDAILDGYLAPVRAKMIPIKLDISSVSLSTGDYDVNEVGHALDPYLLQIAKKMRTICKNRKTVVFLPLVKTSKKFCKILNDLGLHAVHVDGSTPNREQILEDFENSKEKGIVLCNCMLLSEGWDCPSVNTLVVLRPTRSRTLYQQMVGRGMRLAPRKKYLLLLDFLWLTEKHDLCRPSSLICRSPEVAQIMDDKFYQDGIIDLLETEEEAERKILADREAALAMELAEQRMRKGETVDILQLALLIEAERLLNYEPYFNWERLEPTESQLNELKDKGVEVTTIKSRGQASAAISALRARSAEGLCTLKQIKCLKKNGFQQVSRWSKASAKDMINRLKANYWFTPPGIDPATYLPEELRRAKVDHIREVEEDLGLW